MQRRASFIVSILALLALAATLAAGCSTSDKNAYVDEINSIQTELQSSLDTIGASMGESGPEVAATINEGGDELASALADIEDLDVPSDWESQHDDLVAGIETMLGGFDELATAAEAADPTAAQAAVDTITGGAEAADTAISSMNEDRI